MPNDMTRLLSSIRSGSPEAWGSVFEHVFDELRRIASEHLARERRDHTLQPTALVHEAYLRLAGSPADLSNRRQLLAAVSKVMKRVLIDHARRHGAAKRCGGRNRLPLESLSDEQAAAGDPGSCSDLDVEALAVAIERLERRDQIHGERKAAAVRLHYLLKLSHADTGQILGISADTVKRDIRMALALLRVELDGADA